MFSSYKDWVLVQILSCPLEDRQPWQLGDRIGRKRHSALLNYVVPFHLNVFKWRAWLSFKACISSLLLAVKYSRPRSWRFTSLLGASFAFPPITPQEQWDFEAHHQYPTDAHFCILISFYHNLISSVFIIILCLKALCTGEPYGILWLYCLSWKLLHLYH